MKVRVLPKQSLLDIALQETGSIESLFDIARLNNISVSQSLNGTEEMKVSDVIDNQTKSSLDLEPANQYNSANFSDNLGGNPGNTGSSQNGSPVTLVLNNEFSLTYESGSSNTIDIINNVGTVLNLSDDGNNKYKAPNGALVVKNEDNTTIATFPVTPGITENYTSPNGDLKLNGNPLTDVLSGGTTDIELVDQNNNNLTPTVTGAGRNKKLEVNVVGGSNWVRNPEWIAIPEIQSGQEIFHGVFAVFPNARNQAYFRIGVTNGVTSIDWGDGTTDTLGNNQIIRKEFDFDLLPNSTLTSAGFKQVLITVTKGSGASWNGLWYWEQAGNLPLNWLDVNMSLINATDVRGSSYLPYLERFRFKETPAAYMVNLLRNSFRLKVLEIDWSKPITLTGSFGYSGLENYGDMDLVNATGVMNFGRVFSAKTIGNVKYYHTSGFGAWGLSSFKEIGNVDLYNQTVTNTVFLEMHTLSKIGFVNMPKTTSATLFFRNCNQLKSANINAPLLENATHMFYVCYAIQSITFTDLSNLTNSSGMFYGCYCLRNLRVPNIKTSFDLSGTDISAIKMTIVFNDLKDLTGITSKTLTITNTPASSKLTQAQRDIALNKNWTLIG